MPITEDQVKNAIATWLKHGDFDVAPPRLGMRRGFDVEALNSKPGKRLVVECKGETEAANQWDRAWRNVSYALFNAIKQTENPQNRDDVAVALPDTRNYRERMDGLQAFCARQKIAVYWVSEGGGVQPW
ncbi:MAG: hypothetical protein AB1555_14110 [Nitrospirota bacterium]